MLFCDMASCLLQHFELYCFSFQVVNGKVVKNLEKVSKNNHDFITRVAQVVKVFSEIVPTKTREKERPISSL